MTRTSRFGRDAVDGYWGTVYYGITQTRGTYWGSAFNLEAGDGFQMGTRHGYAPGWAYTNPRDYSTTRGRRGSSSARRAACWRTRAAPTASRRRRTTTFPPT